MPTVTVPRILVADDNPLTLRFFVGALAKFGIDGVEAADGRIAVERAGESAFDLLLFDARMPRLGGAAALTHIRTHPGPCRNVAALATSADDDRSTHASLLAAGFADVLVKPVSLANLRIALARYLCVPEAIDAEEQRSDFDDRQALAAAGGDSSIVTALRALLVAELDALPTELAAYADPCDAHALRERLHRLDASAGFCGVPALLRAGAALREALETSAWPAAAITDFLQKCRRIRARLAV
ncbi:MAG: response regulator [Dokdonella sp.]